ncbi:phage virulence factor PagK family protein [Salmonella enterica subsp. diarizonae]|uniref:Phage virulence factor PagK family protein n=1 Tax=Salmonella diarizonae TaxID=59204 RepID=A0A8F5N3U3_SALDZ|nr:phage virulence factor PagK family protein [Salmonella enterica subsp. diarizonae]
MKHVKNVFLVLVFALSAAAFSTSAMAASNPPPPPRSQTGRTRHRRYCFTASTRLV